MTKTISLFTLVFASCLITNCSVTEEITKDSDKEVIEVCSESVEYLDFEDQVFAKYNKCSSEDEYYFLDLNESGQCSTEMFVEAELYDQAFFDSSKESIIYY